MYNNSTKAQKKLLAPLFAFSLFKALGMDSHLLAHTQTGGHIQANLHYVYGSQISSLEKNPEVAQVFKKAMESEVNYTQNDYYVFYHGQMWKIYLLELIYTTLWEIKHKKKVNNYLFPRFPQNSSCFKNAQSIQEQKQTRKKTMSIDSSFAISLNGAAFGNSTNSGSSSFYYFFYNSNESDPNITIKNIFEKFDLVDVYIKNKKQLDKLEQQFLQLSKHGNLLQIAVPRKHLRKDIYRTSKTSLKRNDLLGYIFDKETNDVAEILETLKTHPEYIYNSDQKEFVWVVTADTVQKAISDGVEIKSFNTADPEKLKNLTDELTNLLTKKLASRWIQPEMTPWECYKKHYKKNI